jgi:hypothetical protein
MQLSTFPSKINLFPPQIQASLWLTFNLII